MAGGAKRQGAGGFNLLRLFADRTDASGSDARVPEQHKQSASKARELACALQQLVWDPLTLNDGASALHQPVHRCVLVVS
jgi:hypothetical protein